MINISSVIEGTIIRIPMNTFNSSGASVTVTNLIPANIKIYKDSGLTERSSANGITTSVDYDGITGSHIVEIDLSDNSDNGFFVNGSDYHVRAEGITVDGQTQNIWIGKFIIGFPVWDESLNEHTDIQSAGRKLKNLSDVIILSGTSPNTNTSISIELNGDASTIDGAYDPGIVSIIAGTGAGQSRRIYEYDGTNKLCYVSRDWKIIPDDTSEYQIIADSGGASVNEGKLRAGATGTTAVLNVLASDVDDVYVGQIIFLHAGVGADQAKRITAYNGTTKTVTVESAWEITPTSETIYSILPYYWSVLFDADLAMIADGIWDEPMAGHTTSGTAGAVISFIKSVSGGRWRILGTVLIMYAEDNITEVARFNLIDDGTNVLERVRI